MKQARRKTKKKNHLAIAFYLLAMPLLVVFIFPVTAHGYLLKKIINSPQAKTITTDNLVSINQLAHEIHAQADKENNNNTKANSSCSLPPLQRRNVHNSNILIAVIPKQFPPQYDIDEHGKPDGFAVDVMNAIAAKLDLKIIYLIKDTWAEVDKSLKNGEADIIPNLGISEERRECFIFSTPVETFPISIFTRVDYSYHIQELEDLQGHTVAIPGYNAAVSLLQDNSAITLILLHSIEPALFKLLAGDVDAVVYPQPVFLSLARRIGVEDKIKVVGQPLLEIKRAIAVRKDNPELLAKLDAEVENFILSPEYQEIYLKWYGKPEPFWTGIKVFQVMGSLLLVVVIALLIWRYLSLLPFKRLQKLEKALRASEARYRGIVEDQTELICRFMPEGKLTFVNDAYCRYFNQKKEDLVGSNFLPLIPQEDQEKLQQNLATLSRDNPIVTVEHRVITPTGQICWHQWTNRVILNTQGEIIELQGVGRDITLLKQVEKNLLELNEQLEEKVKQRTAELETEKNKYQTILATALDGFVIIGNKGNFLEVNSSYCKMLGYSREKLLQMSAKDIEGKETESQTFAHIQRMIEKRYDHFETLHKCQNGTMINVEVSANYIDDLNIFIAFIRNITQRKKIERALKKSEAQFHSIFDNVAVGIALVDQQGYVILANEADCKFLGYSEEELKGMHFSQFTHPEYLKIDNDLYQSLLRGERKGYTIDKKYVRKDGKIVWGRLSASLIKNEVNQPVYTTIVCQDITEMLEAETALKESEQRFRNAVLNSPFPILIHAEDGEIIQVNQMLTELTGYTVQQLTNMDTWIELAHGKRKKEVQSIVKELYQLDHQKDEGEFIIKTSTGENRIWNFSAAPLGKLPDGRRLVMSIAMDITELKETQQLLRHHTFYDNLTGLANRTLLLELIEQALKRVKRNPNYLFAVVFVDIDRFKTINDSLGHSLGDELLKAIARRLQKCIRNTDTLARLGGDEFVILLEDLPHYTEAIEVSERINQELAQILQIQNYQINISASIGIALSNTTYQQGVEILRDADLAMYRAKDTGKACYQIFDQQMHIQAIAKLELETDLRKGIEQEEFIVYYQPIFSLQDNQLAGFEALVRWQHPKKGMISPNTFIPLAEETDLIIPLGEWILWESCRQMQHWQDTYPQGKVLTISVNLSPRQLQHPDLMAKIDDILQQTKLNPHSLKLEITESSLIEQTELANVILAQIKNRNIKISIDDFGTGYCSLSYLHRFPVDILKIDQSFVKKLGQKEENSEIVATIIQLANILKLDVIAEGIETQQQLELIKQLGCQFGQGYLFSRPLDHKQATAMINK